MSGDQRRLAAALFVVAWGTNVSTPLILRYQDRLALSNSGAVAIFSVYVAGILLALLFAGRLSDRYGRRPIVVPFTLLSGVGSLVMVVGRDELFVLFAGRFLLGLVSGATLSVGTAWLNELVIPPADFGEGVRDDEQGREHGGAHGEPGAAVERLRLAGIVTVLLYIGFGFGPVTSALWDRWLPEPLIWPYVVHAVACVVVAAAVATLPETTPAEPTVSLRPALGVPRPSRREFRRLVVPAAVWVFGFPSVSFALFPVVLREAIGGADVLVAGAIGSLTAVAVLLSRPIVQRSGDARRALVAGGAIGVVGYTVGTVAFVTGAWWLAPAGAVLLGAASGVLMSAGLAIADELAHVDRRGTLSATFYLVAYSGMTMPLVLTGVGGVASTTTALVGVTVAAALALGWVAAEVRSATVDVATRAG
ncbi:MAG: MFS transporter [Actinomycetota bacterium]